MATPFPTAVNPIKEGNVLSNLEYKQRSHRRNLKEEIAEQVVALNSKSAAEE